MEQRLAISNPSPTKLPGPGLLHQLVANPEADGAIAIEYSPQDGITSTTTFRQLHRRANNLARQLRTIRDRNCDDKALPFIVPLLLPQCHELYISQLAILLAGGAFCPITLDVPEERLRFILGDVGATLLLTTASLRETLPSIDITVIAVDETETDLSDDSPIGSEVTPSQPAYVMYTSGSTGQPKGVILSHAAATQALLAHNRHIPEYRRFLQFASPTFDVSVFEIFFTLFRGATLVCGDRRNLLSDLPGFITRMNIDAAELTPSVASGLLGGRSSVPTIRLLLTIGEMLKHDVVSGFGGDDNEESVLYGMYGPTEATIHCTVQTAFSKDMPVGNIGKPLDTVSAFVVRPAGNARGSQDIEILSIGEEGELAVGGYQLADGYLNRPEQTRNAFVQHEVHGMLYRTGDLVKMTAAGNIECMGRISQGQVKLRGQRIELGEIEYAASRAVGCRGSAASVIDGTLAVFCATEESEEQEVAIRQTCQKWLPGFMVPRHILMMESLPYLASGKIDNRALRELFLGRKGANEDSKQTMTPKLESIVEILSGTLRVPVKPETELSTIGLDSLSAIRLSSAFERQGFSRPDAALLLEAETVNDLEGLLYKTDNPPEVDSPRAQGSRLFDSVSSSLAEHGSSTVNIDNVDDVYEVTALQLSMLGESSLDDAAYHNWVKLHIPGTNTLQGVVQCLRKLAQRHSLLRSGFVRLNIQQTWVGVVWKSLLPSQLEVSSDSIASQRRTLHHACCFQLFQSSAGIHILVNVHHAIYDQWSMDVLRRDLSALLRGQDISKSASFKTVSEFHRNAENHTHAQESVDFWQDYLRNFSPTLLPQMNGQLCPREQHRTDWVALQFNPNRLKKLSHGLGCSTASIFQAAFAFLLGTYIGTTSTTFGLVLSGRHLPISGIEDVFGPCLTTLPFSVDHSTVRTCSELVQLVQERNRDLQKHSLTPLAEIKSLAEAARGIRLFDTLFVWQQSTIASPGSEAYVEEVDSADRHEFNLVLEIAPSNSEVKARVTFQKSLIPHSQVETLIRQLEEIVESIISKPGGLVSELTKSMPLELKSISNIAPSSCLTGPDLISVIESHSANQHDAIALEFVHDVENESAKSESITFMELNQRANRMAHYIRSLNVGTGDMICICMEKSISLYVAILATLKAGCAYLPLLPDIPSGRLESISHQAKFRICITDSLTSSKLSSVLPVQVINITVHGSENYSPDDLNIELRPSLLAYIVFTSGSTGEPKGVQVTRANLSSNLGALKELYQPHKGDKLLQTSSQAFDVSVFEIFFAFYSGICLCSATKEVLFTDIEASIRAMKITHLSMTPTVAALVHPDHVPSVKFLVTAGEGMTELVHTNWAGRGLHQGYGPSETTNIVTINMRMSCDDVPGNIGPPLRNTSAFVVHPQHSFDLLPAGAIGELVFGGQQVFQGYLQRQDLNAEKLIDHPEYGRLYKSGDLGRILPDGSLLISGRLDDQVKIRGNRIELGEVNAAISRYPGVRDSVTIIAGDSAADEMLCSFFVPSFRDEGQEISRLFSHLEDTLPSYMIPSTLVPIDRLPQTGQGKLDRRFLLNVVQNLDETEKVRFSSNADERESHEPWTDIEGTVADILAETLNMHAAKFGRNTSFFAAGLNSLNAIAFARNISHRLDVRVSVRMVLHHSSVARLARAMQSSVIRDSEDTNLRTHDRLLPHDVEQNVLQSLNRREGDVEAVWPCTPLQEAMLAETTSRASSTYCNAMTVKVKVDVNHMKCCWEKMATRHAILRTTFAHTDSSKRPFVQVISRQSPLPWYQYSGVDLGDVEATELSSRAAAVTTASPWRIEAYIGSSETMLLVRMHHALYDGVAINQLLQEVESACKAEPLLAPVSFSGFIRELPVHQGSEATAYWTKKVEGFRPKPFPTVDSWSTHTEKTLQIEECVSLATVITFCGRYAVTPLAVFQAALAKVLVSCQNSTDVCFGNVVSGRSLAIPGIETLVAPCFNTVPVRTDLARSRSNLNLMTSLHRDNTSDLEYQLTPLRHIQRLSLSPFVKLFDALLLLQPPQRQLDSNVWELHAESGTMDLPLVFELVPNEHNYVLSLHHLEPVISAELATDLSRGFKAALLSCLEFPQSSATNIQGLEDIDITGRLAPINAQAPLNPLRSSQTCSPGTEWSREEEAVRSIFAQLAAIEESKVTRETTLFQLGLDSLNAAQVSYKLRTHDIFVDVADVLEHRTPAGIAALSSSKASSAQRQETKFDFTTFDKKYRKQVLKQSEVSSDSMEAVRPCTPLQNGMLAQSLQSAGSLYINHVVYQVPSDVTRDNLKRAWQSVCRKHQMLRTGFHQLEDIQHPFVMTIFQPETIELPLFDVGSHEDFTVIEAHATQHILQNLENCGFRVTLQSCSAGLSMLLSIHHALYDADGLSLLLSDLKRVVDGEVLEVSVTIDTMLGTALSAPLDSASSEEFWKGTLEGFVPCKFPDLTPTVVRTPQLEVRTHTCKARLKSIESYCRAQEATIQALGQYVWALLLAAYTGDQNVIFGTINKDHKASNAESVVFPSITTLPVVCNTGSATKEMLHSTVAYNTSLRRHRLVTLADIQRLAGYPGKSLFDTIFVFQKAALHQTAPWHVVRETAGVDYVASMELEVRDSDDIFLRLTFDTARIPVAQAGFMLEQFDLLMHEVVFGRQPSLSEHPTLFSMSPAKEASIDSGVQLFHQFVEQQQHHNPGAIALEFVHELKNGKVVSNQWTYGQLDHRGNQVANLIMQRGIPSQSVIAVCMDKCPEASFAFLGILKAGCSFLALDPDLPGSRVKFILEDSGARLMLVDKKRHDSSFIPGGIAVLEIKEEYIERFPGTLNASISVPSNATCYCLYTSGTTGTPKGCEITHQNAIQAILAFQRLFAGRWTEKSRWLQFASYWFDVSVLEQFWSWSVGITVVGAPRDMVLEDIANFIRSLCITHIDLTPSLARLVDPEDVPSLWDGVFITGGDALKQEIIDLWGEKRTICNGYGPTEATIGVTMNTFIDGDAKPSNIGRAFDNVGAFVFRPKSDDPVFRGAVGELCVSGQLVGKGYLNRADLTASRFPFATSISERVYRTGDLVRLLCDGSFMFIGRQDTQAKLRGQRLEIGEIENAIAESSPRIQEVAGMVIKSENGHKETLVTFFAATTKQRHKRSETLQLQRNIQELVDDSKAACVERLPAYMVPTHILPINFMPLTVNNKVDNKRLLAFYNSLTPSDLQSLKQSNHGSSRKLNSVEVTIAQALQDLLAMKKSEFTSRSNLFSLGLSSISAIAFSSILRRAGFSHASVTTVMNNPILEQLAEALSSPTGGHSKSDQTVDQTKLWMRAYSQIHHGTVLKTLKIDSSELEAIVPCTPLQQGLLLESMKNDSKPYFNTFVYDLRDVDITRFKKAFNLLTSTSQILRAAFIKTEDGFAQAILRHCKSPIHETKLDDADITHVLAEQKTRWLQHNTEDVLQPLSVHIIRTPKTCMLNLLIHHSLYDGISFDLMMADLYQIYQDGSLSISRPSFTGALPYGPLRQSPSAKTFWTERMRTLEHSAELKPNDEAQDSIVVASWDGSDAESIEESRRALSVSHQALMQTCFELALCECLPIVSTYGVILSGRTIEYENADLVLGPLFNTLPQVIDLDVTKTLSDCIKSCHDSNAAMLPYQHTPLRDIRKWCSRRFGEASFDVVFVCKHVQSVNGVKSLPPWVQRNVEAHADFPLAFEVELQDDGKYKVHVVARTQYFDQAFVQSLLTSFRKAIEHTCASPGIIVKSLFGAGEQFSRPRSRKHEGHNPTLNGVHDFHWDKNACELRKIIATAAGIEASEINEYTSMFSLGLDSIDAVRIASKLRRMGLSLPLSKLLRAQTVPRILRAAVQSNDQGVESMSHNLLQSGEQKIRELRFVQSKIKQDAIERLMPATPNQEALVAEMLQSGFQTYFNHDILRLHPQTDTSKLELALQRVVDATPILRTSFIELSDARVDSIFAQRVNKPAPIQIRRVALQDLETVGEVLEDIRRHVQVNIQDSPPVRFSMLTAESRHFLIVSLAHALYDGYSLALMHQDILRAYDGDTIRRPPADRAIELALRAQSKETQQFWRGRLSGASVCTFPRSRDASVGKTYRGERCSSISVSSAREFCRTHGVSVQAFTQCSWALTLASYLRKLDVLFGVVLACRDSEEAESTPFPMMNTVVMRANLHGSRSQMLQHTQRMITDMLPHQRTPLRMIRAASGDAIQGNDTRLGPALFDTLFIHQHNPVSENHRQRALYESIGEQSKVEFPVAVEVESSAKNLVIRVACDDTVMGADGCETLLSGIDETMHSIIAGPDEPTIEIQGENARISGLVPFQIQGMEDAINSAKSESTNGMYDDKAVWKDPEILLAIKTVLAEVSKVPLESLEDDSTVESLGIDSISAIKVASLLRNQSIRLSVSDIIKARTASGMTTILSSSSEQTNDSDCRAQEVVKSVVKEVDLPKIASLIARSIDEIEAVLPATAGQLYMLQMWKKTNGRLFYPCFTYRLGASATPNEVDHAWNLLVSDHAILRTCFCVSGLKNLPLLQLILKSSSTSTQSHRAYSGQINLQPWVTMQRTRDEHGMTMHIKIHHALYDAVAMPLILSDFASRLTGAKLHVASPKLVDLLAISLPEHIKSSQKQFWIKYLADCRPMKLPQPTKTCLQRKVDIYTPDLSMSVNALASFVRREGLSLQSILFAVYAKTHVSIAARQGKINSGSPDEDVVLGIYLSNRGHLTDLDRLRAPTINLIPLVVKSPRQKAVLDLARQIQADLQEIGTAEISATALWEIAEWTGVTVDTFVNFLRLPCQDGDSETASIIHDASTALFTERSGIKETDAADGFEIPPALQHLPYADAYKHSVDIEMTIAKGGLNVGFFSPAEMVDLSAAKDALEILKVELEAVASMATT